MKTCQLIVCGATGRMGKEIVELAKSQGWIGEIASVDYRGRADYKSLAEISVSKPAVVVDFSLPGGLAKTLGWCKKNKIPCVVGITGLNASQHKLIKSTAKFIPILWSANMSLGINVFARIIRDIAKVLSEYDWQLEEFHHSKKKDKPSGTGKWLQEVATNSLDKKLPPIMSGRGGGVFGTHKLHLMGPEETLTIEHVALNRTLFARGALLAAKWLASRRVGLYLMDDVLDEK